MTKIKKMFLQFLFFFIIFFFVEKSKMWGKNLFFILENRKNAQSFKAAAQRQK